MDYHTTLSLPIRQDNSSHTQASKKKRLIKLKKYPSSIMSSRRPTNSINTSKASKIETPPQKKYLTYKRRISISRKASQYHIQTKTKIKKSQMKRACIKTNREFIINIVCLDQKNKLTLLSKGEANSPSKSRTFLLMMKIE